MTDPTNKARQAAYRARRAKEGLKEVRGIWADPDLHAEIKEAAEQIIDPQETEADYLAELERGYAKDRI